jgi:stage II sporulation protein D
MTEPTVAAGIHTDSMLRIHFPNEYILNGSTGIRGDITVLREGQSIRIADADDRSIALNPDAGECVFDPADGSEPQFVIRGVMIGREFHWERRRDQRYCGSLRIVPEQDQLTAVNLLPVETYLRSVVSSEMSGRGPFEFLKAHAVISRGWLLAQIENRGRVAQAVRHFSPAAAMSDDEIVRWYDRAAHTLYDVCGDDHCQRYQGIGGGYDERAGRAVEETRGMVLKHGGGVCDARYSKCCGGMTEAFENVWEPVRHAYLTAVADRPAADSGDEGTLPPADCTVESNAAAWIRGRPPAFCNTTDAELLEAALVDFDRETMNFYRWETHYTQDELAAIIAEKSGMDLGVVRDLQPVERGGSARLIRLRIVGTKRELVVGKELEIRRLLSSTHLYSSAFIVEKLDIRNGIPGRFVLKGAGWGHGVGLCQIGAAVMGAKGYACEAILRHYFRGARLERAY